MRVEPLAERYLEAAAALLGRPAERLRARPSPAWVACAGDEVAAVAVTLSRPDRRTFVSLAGDLDAYGPLVTAAAAELRRPLYAHADTPDTRRLDALAAAGFAEEVVTEAFRIRFDAALGALRHARAPKWCALIDAAAADPGRLFTLDTSVRQDVPGTEGWRGDRAMFLDELADPAAYAVAVDEANGEYAGLARVWRNPAGPRFGLVGVLRQYRGSPVGPALIRAVLEKAAGWGHETFTTETSVTNRALHHRLVRLAAERLGRSVQLRRPGTLR